MLKPTLSKFQYQHYRNIIKQLQKLLSLAEKTASEWHHRYECLLEEHKKLQDRMSNQSKLLHHPISSSHQPSLFSSNHNRSSSPRQDPLHMRQSPFPMIRESSNISPFSKGSFSRTPHQPSPHHMTMEHFDQQQQSLSSFGKNGTRSVTPIPSQSPSHSHTLLNSSPHLAVAAAASITPKPPTLTLPTAIRSSSPLPVPQVSQSHHSKDQLRKLLSSTPTRRRIIAEGLVSLNSQKK